MLFTSLFVYVPHVFDAFCASVVDRVPALEVWLILFANIATLAYVNINFHFSFFSSCIRSVLDLFPPSFLLHPNLYPLSRGKRTKSESTLPSRPIPTTTRRRASNSFHEPSNGTVVNIIPRRRPLTPYLIMNDLENAETWQIDIPDAHIALWT